MRHPLWSEHTRVFVDTNSLMEDTAATFIWTRLIPLLRAKGIPSLIVAKSVVDELDRLASDGDESTARRARAAKLTVKSLLDADEAEVRGEKNDSFPDNLFLALFTSLRLKYRLILITQDRKLAKDILSLNSSSSVDRIRGIDAFRIGSSGDPMRWQLDPSDPSGVKYILNQLPEPGNQQTKPDPASAASASPSSPSSVEPFARPQDVAQLNDTPLNMTEIPGSDDVVKDANGAPLRLGEKLGSGGEGTTYETDNALVCKVYQRSRLKQSTIDKIKLMSSRQVRHPAICWPISLAYNSHNEAVGYLMPKAEGKELQTTVFIPPRLQKIFPHWIRWHLVQLTSTILNAVAYLHSLNVLLGDINARNILVQDASTVFFVDCDSYQVEGFPCPVGQPPYLAPELYGEKLSSTLRTLEHEHFAIATLVFMLLHPGKPPYSHEGGGDPSENVRKQHFPYPLGDRHGSRSPTGPWRFIWSHLPYYVKEAFYKKVFGPDSHLSKRLSVTEWQALMRRYENDFAKGYFSDELFPKGFKQLTKEQAEQNGIPWRYCGVCGKGFPVYQDHFTKCYDCRAGLLSSRPQ